MSSGELNPRDAKVRLAKIFVERFHSSDAAEIAEKEFVEIFSKKGLPDEIAEKAVEPSHELWICKLMVDIGLSQSTSEARRLVEGGGVEMDGKKISDAKLKMNLLKGESFVLKAGKKKFAKVLVK
jgi:tyrosyl-tRNA synthetase